MIDQPVLNRHTTSIFLAEEELKAVRRMVSILVKARRSVSVYTIFKGDFSEIGHISRAVWASARRHYKIIFTFQMDPLQKAGNNIISGQTF